MGNRQTNKTERDNFDDFFENPNIEKIDEGHIASPFDPSLIDIDTKQPTISNIIDQIRHNEINLAPSFQRSGNLWDCVQQSRLIESILLRIPLPAFYFDVEILKDSMGISSSKWNVIDGLQRLSAIRNFMLPEMSKGNELTLDSLEFLEFLNGKSFVELPGSYQRVIQQTQLITYLIKPGTPENVKFNIFKRVNTGGLPLSQQEIRHALNQGKATSFLEKLAESIHFKKATAHKINSKRMLDREFVNRFLAFYLLPFDSYTDLDSFLNNALKEISGFSDAKLNEIEKVFYDSLDTLVKCFGKYAFCKLDIFPKSKPINKVLFEVMTVSVARLSFDERTILRESACLEKYIRLFKDDSNEGLISLISIWTTEKNRLNKRYKIISDFLQEIIHA